MSIQLSVNDKIRPHALQLIQDGSGGLSVAQIEYWQELRAIEKLARRHFGEAKANEVIRTLVAFGSDALNRDEPGFVDLEALQNLKDDLCRDGTEIRNKGLRRKNIALAKLLGIAAFLFVIWLILVSNRATLIELFFVNMGAEINLFVNAFGVYGTGLAGIALGAITKSFFSNRIVSFEGLSDLENYNFTESLYLTYMVVLFSFVAVILHIGLIEILFNDMNLSALFNQPLNAFFVGIMCGFSEAIIVARISGAVEDTAAGQ